jgi:hypothetical protein
MKSFALILYAISVLVSIEGQIRKYPSGSALIEGIADGTIKFMSWRASADVRESLLGLSRFFGWSVAALFGGFVLLHRVLPPSAIVALSVATFGAFYVWLSFRWFFDFKKQVAELAPFGLFIVVSPWFLVALSEISPTQFDFFAAYKDVFLALGIQPPTQYLSATILSGILLVGFLVCLLASAALFLSLPTIIFFALWGLSKLCGHWLRHKPTWLYHTFLAYYVVVTMYFAAMTVFPNALP